MEYAMHEYQHHWHMQHLLGSVSQINCASCAGTLLLALCMMCNSFAPRFCLKLLCLPLRVLKIT